MSEPITQEKAEAASEWIRDHAASFGKAKSERVYLDEFRKSKKALLMQLAPTDLKSSAAQESWAYSQPEYLEVLQGLKVAVEKEETIRWQLIAAQVRIELFRTIEASNRRA